MVDIEDLTESELDVLHKYYQKLSDIAEADQDIHRSHSIDEAVKNHKLKAKRSPEEKAVRKAAKLKRSKGTEPEA